MYDSLGRLVTVYDLSNNAAVYKYDAVGNLLSITNYSSGQFNALELGSSFGATGSTLTIYGTDFCASPTVTINGTVATVQSSTATQIVVTVPAGATSGPVVVTCNSTPSTAGSFTIGTNAPSITGFGPSVGTAGTTVTITGTGFQTNAQNETVRFNDSEAQILSSSATTITASVPADTTSGPISVTTPYGSTSTSAAFFIPPSGATLGYTTQIALGGSATAFIGTANQVALILFAATARQTVSLNLTSSTFSTCPVVTLLDPFGSTAYSGNYCGSSKFIDAVHLNEAGMYTVEISPGNSTGSVTLQLYNSPSQTATITPGGPPVTVTNTVPGQDTYVTFSATAGQQVSLAVTNNVTGACPVIWIYPPGVNPAPYANGWIAEKTVCGSTTFFDAMTLVAAGTYTIIVDPDAGTGSVTLQLYNSPSQTATITPGGPPVTVTNTVPGQDTYVTFNAAAGQQVSLAITNNVTGACPLVWVYPPSVANPTPFTGGWLAQTTVCGSTAFMDVMTIPTAGTATIIVDPDAGTGSATLQLYNSPSQTATITPDGPPVTVTNTVPGQDTYVTFNAAAGQQVSLSITNNVTGACPLIWVYPPSVANPAPYTGGWLGTATVCGSTAFMDVMTIPTAGTATIIVDPGAGTGSVTLQLYNSPSQTATITPGGGPVTVTNTAPGQDSYLTFSGTAGQQVSLSITNNVTGSCPLVWVYPPAVANPAPYTGGWLSATTVCGSGAFVDTFTLTTGTYTMIVDTDNGTGSVTLQLNNAPTQMGTITIGGSPVTVTSSVPGQDSQLTFSGTAGQNVTLGISSDTMTACSLISIYNPDNSQLTSSTICGTSASIGPKVLPTTGTYTIFVDVGSGTGSMNLTLTAQ